MDRKEFQDILESIKIPEGTLAEDLQRLVSPLNKALYANGSRTIIQVSILL